MALSKVKKLQAEEKAQLMLDWTPREWANYNRRFDADSTVAELHEVEKEAYKLYMIKTGQGLTESLGGHYAELSYAKGRTTVNYNGMLDAMRQDGVDVDAYLALYTEQGKPQARFKFH